MTGKPTKFEGVIYPRDIGCTTKPELLSSESHWRSSEAPKNKIIASSKYETHSLANKIRCAKF